MHKQSPNPITKTIYNKIKINNAVFAKIYLRERERSIEKFEVFFASLPQGKKLYIYDF